MEHRELPVAEIFGPTIQGEGADIGRTMIFLRFYGCPVRCPNCDTAYSWKGKEGLNRMTSEQILNELRTRAAEFPGCGLVVTGGEPLSYFGWNEMREILHRSSEFIGWTSLETSGVTYPRPNLRDSGLGNFLPTFFDRIHCCPKVTPSLPSQLSPEILTENIERLTEIFPSSALNRLVFKLIVNPLNDADEKAILEFDEKFQISKKGYPIYLMPEGYSRNVLLLQIEALIPFASKHGFMISPRLHALLWGNEKGR